MRVTSEAGEVTLRIRNVGPGIASDDLPHIFDPLYRAEGSRSGPGSGLGLSVVKSVIGSHGWDIQAESTPGGSTVFTIRIPTVSDSTAADPPG